MVLVWSKVKEVFYDALKSKLVGIGKAKVSPDVGVRTLRWIEGRIKDTWNRFVPVKGLSEWSIIERKRIDDWRRVWVKIDESVLGIRPDFDRLYTGRVVVRDIENKLHVKYFNQPYGHEWDYELEKRQISSIVRDVRQEKKTSIDYKKYVVFKEYFEYSLNPPRKR